MGREGEKIAGTADRTAALNSLTDAAGPFIDRLDPATEMARPF